MNYVYITTADSQGKTFLIGPFENEFEARKKSDSLDRGFDLVDLPTRDLSKATRIYKAKQLDTMGIDRATRKVGHKVKGQTDTMSNKIQFDLNKRLEELKKGLHTEAKVG